MGSPTNGDLLAVRENSTEDHLPERRFARSSPRLLIFSDPSTSLPAALMEQVAILDPDAPVKRSWPSVMDALTANACRHPDVIIDVVTEPTPVMRRIRELWEFRVLHNYSPRPIYFAISKQRPPATVRFEIERRGGRLLCLFDVATHFQSEIEQIRLEFAPAMRSLPSWLIVQEGNGKTLRAVVNLVGRRKSVRVPGSDRLIAALAAFIKHNGIPRSLSAWQKVLADDSLFRPAGGGFALPSISTLKMYLHRGFRNCLQRTFDEYRSGFCAERVIERIDPGSHGAQYRIRGEWEVIRR